MGFFYCSKVTFTIVNTILSVPAYFHFTIVNVHLVCCDNNFGRMKVKFTKVKQPEKAWFIMSLSKLTIVNFIYLFLL